MFLIVRNLPHDILVTVFGHSLGHVSFDIGGTGSAKLRVPAEILIKSRTAIAKQQHAIERQVDCAEPLPR